jgi:hypothetical protein
MRRAVCSSCGTEFPVSEMFSLDQTLVCRACAESRARQAQATGQKIQFGRILDPTICWKCKTDYGDQELSLVAGAPTCGRCAATLYASPFPVWLKAGLAGLLVLLVVALWNGRRYFAAGRHLVLAERAMDRSDFAAADLQFAEVLKVKPTKQRVILLGAKAGILSGDAAQGLSFLQQRDSFAMDELFTEVKGLWDGVSEAFSKVGQAVTQDSLGHVEEAARLMNEASRAYPQSVQLAMNAIVLDSHAAYERKDYDAFLQLSRAALAKIPDSPTLVSGVASALACKYAVTGNVAFRVEAESLLAHAHTLAMSSPEEMARYDEYAERIRYRLDTRVIIDKDEYDRRFRSTPGKR